MAETLYEQIKDAEETLELENKPDDGGQDGKNDDGGVQHERQQPVQRQTGQKPSKRPEQGKVSELGGGGTPDGRPSGKGKSRDDGGSPSGDARASQRSGGEAQEDGSVAQEDAPASQEDGEGVLEEKPLTNREQAAARIKIRALEAEVARLKGATPSPAVEVKPVAEAKPAVETASTKEPDQNVNYKEWLEWKIAQSDNTVAEQTKLLTELRDWKKGTEAKTAEQQKWDSDADAFIKIEAQYTQKNPDYGNAADYARDTYFKSIKMAMPQASDKQINDAINNEIMGYARQWSAAGLNPAQEFYDMAIERFGYEPKAETQEEEQQETVVLPGRGKPVAQKPNLKVIANNKRRSATPLSGGGQGGSVPLTKQAAALDMSVGEFSKLTPEELSALEDA